MKSKQLLTTLLLVLLMGLPTAMQAQEDSLAVSLLGHIDVWTWLNARDVVVVDNYALLTCDSPSLFVVDIHDPTQPTEVARLFLDTPVRRMAMAGPDVLILTGDPVSYMVDISDPTDPTVIGSIQVPDAYQVTVNGDLAVLTGGWQLTVLDISDPTAPAVIATFDPGVSVAVPTLQGSLLAVMLNDADIGLVDLSDPADPTLLSQIDGDDGNYDPLALQGTVLYRLLHDELVAWDISDPSNPQTLGELSVGPGNGQLLTVDGDRAFVMRTQHGLRVIDVSNPSAMVSLGALELNDLNGFPEAQTLQGSHLFYTDGDQLATLDVSDPPAMDIVSTYSPPDRWHKVTTEGDRVYIGLDSGAIRGYDVSDPADPVPLGDWPLDTDGFSNLRLLGVHRGFAYVATTTFIHVYDVSTPGVNPPPWQVHLNYTAKEAAFAGDRVFVTVGNWGYPDMGGVMMLSAPPTEAPELLWYDIRLGWYSPQVALDQGRLIVFHGRFVVYDLTLGPEPVEVADVDVSHGSRGFDVENGIAYVADYGLSYSVMHIHNLRDLDDIHEIDAVTTTEQWPGIVEARGDQLCVDMTPYQVGSGHGGMFVMDVSDPAASRIRGYHKGVHFLEWMRGGQALVRGDGYIGVADISAATAVDEGRTAEHSPSSGFTLLPTYPNPLNPTATVRVSTPVAGPIRVTVHDLLGRTVATLGNRRLNAGTHQWVIDGSSWASGVYLVRAQGPGGQLRSERITLVK